MEFSTRTIQRLTLAVSLSSVSVAVVATLAGEPGAQPAVEFSVKDGSPCLQAVVHVGTPKREDYGAAEQTWLASAHPGDAARRWQIVLRLPPDPANDGDPESGTVIRDTAYLDSGITVCFEINSTEREGKPNE